MDYGKIDWKSHYTIIWETKIFTKIIPSCVTWKYWIFSFWWRKFREAKNSIPKCRNYMPNYLLYSLCTNEVRSRQRWKLKFETSKSWLIVSRSRFTLPKWEHLQPVTFQQKSQGWFCGLLFQVKRYRSRPPSNSKAHVNKMKCSLSLLDSSYTPQKFLLHSRKRIFKF